MSDNNIQFLLAATHALVGGQPALAISEDKRYSVWPMCTCEHCQGFRDNFETKFTEDLVEAMKLYADDMEVYSESIGDHRTLH